jgi:hypothetical protein
VTAIPLHRSAVGVADSTLEVCLIEFRDGASPPDPNNSEAILSQPLSAGAHKRPPGPVLSLTSLFLASPAHSTRVPIHISQVPRG